MPPRSLKQRLVDGETVVGTFVNVDSPAVTEAATLAGLDFTIIDQEHGPLTAETSLSMCMGAEVGGGAPIVRVRGNEAPEIQRALDVGAAGVQIPQVESRADAEAAVEAARFAPEGGRGLSPYVRAGEYGLQDDYTGTQNERTLLIVHVEGQEGIDNLDGILAVDGIDVIFLGPYDLSQALGVPGEVTSEQVVETMSDICDRARAADTVVGAYADTPAIANQWIESGVQYVAVSVDCSLLQDRFAEVADAVDS
ncbi:HpcH/HpaI aldolase/citrate lyase family protein [Halomicroarcula sp. GCM10025817]|uniref:HpcH/HpaI aldolase family protein n=1 Tax=Haloarcula TaxID=2237 RepID=UPI0023E8A05A|nr:aldolase/citrate lyase family protein [Halomicroarcula sp. SYNS111]